MSTQERPKRIQRKRTKGWKMPTGAVYVGRPTQWGNPFKAHDRARLRSESVKLFRKNATAHLSTDPLWLDQLRGKDLACWCPLDQPCHADVLLELANREPL